MTTKLPRPTEPFTGQVERLITDAKARRLEAPAPPDNAPNVLLVMLDDVGFGSFSTFGGPVEAAGFQSVADNGLLYNQFHTTALCSPTRAALLTGRQHHSVHMGGITEIATLSPATIHKFQLKLRRWLKYFKCRAMGRPALASGT